MDLVCIRGFLVRLSIKFLFNSSVPALCKSKIYWFYQLGVNSYEQLFSTCRTKWRSEMTGKRRSWYCVWPMFKCRLKSKISSSMVKSPFSFYFHFRRMIKAHLFYFQIHDHHYHHHHHHQHHNNNLFNKNDHQDSNDSNDNRCNNCLDL